MVKITAIVIASGMSKRMNTSKLHMDLGDKKVYEYILETIKECDFYEVVVVAKDDDILEKANTFGFASVRNKTYYLGQSESIKHGLTYAKACDGYMFFVADQPFIKVETIKKLCSEFAMNDGNIVLPYYNGVRGNPVIFPYSMKDELICLEGDRGGKVVINQNQDKITKVDIVTEYEFIDIDTSEDYEKLASIIATIFK